MQTKIESSKQSLYAYTTPRQRVSGSVRYHCVVLGLSKAFTASAIDLAMRHLDGGMSEAYAIAEGKQSAERFARRAVTGQGTPHNTGNPPDDIT